MDALINLYTYIGYPCFKVSALNNIGTDEVKKDLEGKVTLLSAHCKYGNCTHRHEPGCAVRDAVEKHLISESRYTSYLNMLEDKEEGKYRAAY